MTVAPAGGEAPARGVLGFVLLWRRELSEAEEHLLAVRSMAERIGDLPMLVRTTVYVATLCRLAADSTRRVSLLTMRWRSRARRS